MTQKVSGVDPLREAFRSLADGAGPAAGCPPASRLWDAQQGDVPPEEARRLMDHAASCPSCAQAWRLARELDEGAATETSPQHSVWPRARSILAMAAMALLALAAGYMVRALSDTNDPPAAPAASGRSPETTAEKLQAAETRIAALEQQVARLSSTAHVNVPFIELQPEPLRSSARPPTTVTIPATATMAVLILATDGVRAGDTHTLELIDENRRVTWSASGVRSGADGAFTAVVPTSQLPAGSYRLTASADRPGGRAPIQEYRVRIVYRQP